MRPFVEFLSQIKLSIDGNQWCVLLGDNLQDGVAGFGNSPSEASRAFDLAWVTPLPVTRPKGKI